MQPELQRAFSTVEMLGGMDGVTCLPPLFPLHPFYFFSAFQSFLFSVALLFVLSLSPLGLPLGGSAVGKWPPSIPPHQCGMSLDPYSILKANKTPQKTFMPFSQLSECQFFQTGPPEQSGLEKDRDGPFLPSYLTMDQDARSPGTLTSISSPPCVPQHTRQTHTTACPWCPQGHLIPLTHLHQPEAAWWPH